MKKTFTKFLAALMLLAIFTPSMIAVGQTYTKVMECDMTTKAYGCSAYNTSTDYGDWTIVNGANNNKSWAYFKMGGRNTTISSYNPCYIYSKTAASSSVDKITVHLPAGSLSKNGMSVNSWGIYVYSNAAMTTQVDYVAGGTITGSEGSFDFTPSTGVTWASGYYYKVSWDLANTTTTNGIVCVDKITLYKESSAAATTTTVNATGITNTDVYVGTAAGSLSATVTAGGSAVSGATVTWSGNNDAVATIDASTGVVTLVAAGNVTFTASYAGVSGTYQASSGTYDMTVTSSAPYVQPTTVEANLNNSLFGTSYNGSVTGITDDNPIVGTLDNVTVTYAGSGNHYVNDSQIRFYPNNKLTFDAPSGYDITQIVFTSDGTWTATITADLGTYTSNTKTWTGSESSIIFTGSVSGRCDMSKATITLEAAGSAVATTTTINVPGNFNTDLYNGTAAGTLTATVAAGGTSIGSATVTWSSSNEAVATIAANGTVTLVSVGTTTITASYAGVEDEYKPSSANYVLEVVDSTPVLSSTYIFNTDAGLAALNITKPAASNGTDLDANHDYVIGDVTMNCTHASTNTRVWNNNGNTDLRIYNTATLTFSVPTGYAISKITVAGTTVAMSGLTSGVWTASGDPVRTVTLTATTTNKINTITVEYKANANVVDAPTLPESTAFIGTMSVEITNIPQGATVYYTIDGSNPKTSTTRHEYTQAIVLNSTTTIKAVAYISPNYSALVEATYTLPSQKTIAEARAQETGYVYTQGVVTSCVGNTGYIQDNNAAICVYGQALTVGDNIKVLGTLSTYKGLLEITNPSIEVVSHNNTVNPTVMTIAEINASTNQGWFVRIENATVTEIDNNNNTTIAQGANTIIVHGISGVAIEVDDVLSLNGNIGCYTNAQIANPSSVSMTCTIDITGYNTSEGGYVLIASPVTEDINPSAENGFFTSATSEDFDLYRYNPNATGAEWENWKRTDSHYHYAIETGRGYLYASKTNTQLSFTGTLNTATDVELAYTGYNLIGNSSNATRYISGSYYIMNSNGTDIILSTRNDNSVNAMEGIVVNGTAGATVTFSTNAKRAENSRVILNIINSRGNVIDRAIVSFDENGNMPKFMIDETNTKIYFPQSEGNYAIVSSNGQGTMPVNFKAKEIGQYTISVETEGIDLSYLHLIDRLTGDDINLLLDSKYSFVATNSDIESRFILSFSENGINANNETFAFQNGSDIIVNGEGELQVFDVTGRMVKNTVINGVETIAIPQGVYIFRLNENIQKIVVR